MPELPRDRPHIHLHDIGRAEGYTSRQRPRTPPAPARNREVHARNLITALNHALLDARAQAEARGNAASRGFQLQFELAPGNEEFVQNLEDRRKGIELLSVKTAEGQNARIIATVFVPDRAADYFLRKLEAYQTQVTAKGRPRHENLVNRIETVALAVIRQFFTDDENLLPANNERIWWEVWLRAGLRDQFQAAATALEIRVKLDEVVEFPNVKSYSLSPTWRRLGDFSRRQTRSRRYASPGTRRHSFYRCTTSNKENGSMSFDDGWTDLATMPWRSACWIVESRTLIRSWQLALGPPTFTHTINSGGRVTALSGKVTERQWVELRSWETCNRPSRTTGVSVLSIGSNP